ncbi:hypothetical protein L3X38_031990 [Prunus dulcis]|uniref:Uncharacterized protein n=1 Tax=Prunus dulcis TaxID=3755 RepID=A0AAD4VE93_PRUDU|nr:hypothetical protein L3X38_031990 [Prunus dulcis]
MRKSGLTRGSPNLVILCLRKGVSLQKIKFLQKGNVRVLAEGPAVLNVDSVHVSGGHWSLIYGINSSPPSSLPKVVIELPFGDRVAPKGLMTGHPLPLVAVYKDGTRVAPFDNQPVASTSGRSEGTVGPSRPRVTIVHRGPPRVPVGVPQRVLFGVDYLEPNKITERELEKIRAEYLIPDSVRMRIPSPVESLSNPADGEVAFFTDVLLQGVRLPLQPAVQRILAQIGYADQSLWGRSNHARALRRRFLRSVNGNQGDFLRSSRHSKLPTISKMSDSESPFRNEPNAFDGELSSGWDTSSEAVSLGAEGVEDTDDELFGEEVQSAPVHGVGKGL